MPPEEFGAKPTAYVRLVESPDLAVDPLFPYVLTRRTSRLPHEGAMITEEELAAIVEHARCKCFPRFSAIADGSSATSEGTSIPRTRMVIPEKQFSRGDRTRGSWCSRHGAERPDQRGSRGLVA